MLQSYVDYTPTKYGTEKSTTKAIALADKINYMLERQIVKALGNQINIENPVFVKYAIISFHSIVWIFDFCHCYYKHECLTTEVGYS